MTRSNDVAWEPQPLPEVLVEQLRSHGFQPTDSAEVARQIGEAVGPAASAALFVDLGACNFLDGDIDGAIATWRRAVSSGQVAPGARALLNLGLLYEHLHLHDRAISVLRSAVERQAEPFATEASIAEARCHCAKGDNFTALATLARLTENLIVNQPRSGLLGFALLQLGDVARSAGRPDRAERAWRAAAASHVQNVENVANEKLISLLIELGRDDEARQVIDESTTSRATLSASQRLQRAELLVELGRGEGAVELLATVRGDRLEASERFRLADVLLEQGLINESIDHLESLIESPLVDHQMRARYALGEVYRLHGMVIEAEEMYQSVIDGGHRYWSPKAGLQLGDLHDERDDIEGAVGLWVRAASSPVQEVREDAEARLTDRVSSSLALARAAAVADLSNAELSAEEALLQDIEQDDLDQPPVTIGDGQSADSDKGAMLEVDTWSASSPKGGEAGAFVSEILATEDNGDQGKSDQGKSDQDNGNDGDVGGVVVGDVGDVVAGGNKSAAADDDGADVTAGSGAAAGDAGDGDADVAAGGASAGDNDDGDADVAAGGASAGDGDADVAAGGASAGDNDDGGGGDAGAAADGAFAGDHGDVGGAGAAAGGAASSDDGDSDAAGAADPEGTASAEKRAGSPSAAPDEDAGDNPKGGHDSGGSDATDTGSVIAAAHAEADNSIGVTSGATSDAGPSDRSSGAANTPDVRGDEPQVAARSSRFVAPKPAAPPTVIPLRVASLADDLVPPASIEIGAPPTVPREPFIVALGAVEGTGADVQLSDPFAELAPPDASEIGGPQSSGPSNPYAELSPANLVAQSEPLASGALPSLAVSDDQLRLDTTSDPADGGIVPGRGVPRSAGELVESESGASTDPLPGQITLPLTSDVPGAVPFGSEAPIDELRWKGEQNAPTQRDDEDRPSPSPGFFSSQLDE